MRDWRVGLLTAEPFGEWVQSKVVGEWQLTANSAFLLRASNRNYALQNLEDLSHAGFTVDEFRLKLKRSSSSAIITPDFRSCVTGSVLTVLPSMLCCCLPRAFWRFWGGGSWQKVLRATR
jgi:hypothetical protein